jgi:hypothetical protein
MAVRRRVVLRAACPCCVPRWWLTQAQTLFSINRAGAAARNTLHARDTSDLLFVLFAAKSPDLGCTRLKSPAAVERPSLGHALSPHF